MVKRGLEQRDSMKKYLFDSERWVEIQANVAGSEGGSIPPSTAAEDAVSQLVNFNRNEMSDQDYAARVANMQLAISRVCQSWQ